MNNVDQARMQDRAAVIKPLGPIRPVRCDGRVLGIVDLWQLLGCDVELTAMAVAYSHPITTLEGAQFAADRARELLAGGHLSQDDFRFAVDRVEAALSQMAAPIVDALAARGML